MQDAPGDVESAAGDGASLVSGATGATGAAGRRSFTGRRSMSDEKPKDSSAHGGAEGNRSGKGIKFNEVGACPAASGLARLCCKPHWTLFAPYPP